MSYLYHGTICVINNIDLNKCRSRTDFGKGFYMSSKLKTARDWAIGKPSLEMKTPTVMRYKINDAIYTDIVIKKLVFTTPTKEWLNFVRDNRQRKNSTTSEREPRHTYDVVSGPIADDKVVDVVNEYCKSLISAEDAISRIKTLPNVIQTSFHTPLALSYLSSFSYSQCLNNKWCDWKEHEFYNVST
ncbi:MAG: DUF3990 domain-containing protein [Oscillospiraceae bacterium]|jgi:hypothetical protein|nr:DUF3990 domain-containing protein [Oscillospiraceae bacterium]